MPIDVMSNSDLAWELRVALKEGGYPDLQVIQAGAHNLFLRSSSVVLIRALKSEGAPIQLAMQRILACYEWLSTRLSPDTWWLQVGTDDQNVPTIWISGRRWLAGG